MAQAARPFAESVKEQVQIASHSEDPSWLRSIRQHAQERFSTQGIPGNKVEAWRFTSVKSLGQSTFMWPEGVSGGSRPRKSVDNTSLLALKKRVDTACGEVRGLRVVTSRGRWTYCETQNGFHEAAAELSPFAGIRVGELGLAARAEIDVVQGNLGRIVDADHFAALNTAMFSEGLWIEVAAGAHIDRPIELIRLHEESLCGVAGNERLLVVVGEAGSLSLTERDVHLASPRTSTPVPTFNNAVHEIVLRDNAELRHLRFSKPSPSTGNSVAVEGCGYQVTTLGIEQQSASRYRGVWAALGGRLNRSDVSIRMLGEGASVDVSGGYLAAKGDQVDHHVVIDHKASHTESRLTIHGAAGDGGKGVFDAIAKVRPRTAQVEAHQHSKNLLLHENAVVHTKPHLEIEADEVACSHGATVGAIDEEQVFYARARGISERAARTLLTEAFMAQVLGVPWDSKSEADVQSETRVFLDSLVEAQGHELR